MKDESNQYDCAIIGGNFAGLFASHYLTTHHHKKVILLEASNKLGGVMQPILFKGLKMDLGAQYISTIFPHITDYFVQLSNDSIVPTKFNITSRFYDKIHPTAGPDLTHLNDDILQQIQTDLLSKSKIFPAKRYQTYDAFMHNRWGKSARDYLTPFIRKVTLRDPQEIDQTSLYLKQFYRINISKNNQFLQKFSLNLIHHMDMIVRKYIPNKVLIGFFNQINKKNRVSDPNRKFDYWNNYYPRKKYIGAFLEEMLQNIKQHHIETQTQSKVVKITPAGKKLQIETEAGEFYNVQNILWCSPLNILENILLQTNELVNFESSSGALIIFFVLNEHNNIPENGYLEQMDDDMLLWRISSNQSYVDDDPNHIKNYITIEAPFSPEAYENSNLDDLKQQLWQEATDLNIVSGKMPDENMHLYSPYIHKIFLKDHSKIVAKINKKIKKLSPNIQFLKPHISNRAYIAHEIINICDKKFG